MDQRVEDNEHLPAVKADAYREVAQCTAAGEISEFAVIAEGEERTTWFIWLLVCCCTISGLLFGMSALPMTSILYVVNGHLRRI